MQYAWLMTTHEQNLLLGALPANTLERLRSHLTTVEIPVGGELHLPGDEVERVHFPMTGVVSITTIVSGTIGEVATVGCEGMVGLPVVFGTNVALLRASMQVGGLVAHMPAAIFAEMLDEDAALRSLMFRYAETVLRQVGQSVVCNQRHTLRQRCARWLLMTRDRVPGDEFHLTHESLAIMLGVRRAGVTVAAGALQRAGLIRYRRGLITILDRHGLEKVSCECYRVVQNAYTQLLGPEG